MQVKVDNDRIINFIERQKMKKICCILAVLTMICSVVGCSNLSAITPAEQSPDKPENQKVTESAGKFNDKMMALADQLDKNAVGKGAQDTFIVTSFTNLDKLSETTSIGRLIAENLMHGLQLHKWQVFEVRLTKGIDINEAGEFSLSRDIAKLKDEYKISGIVTGTYSVAEGNLTINARVIDINSGIVLSSAQSYIPLSWIPEAVPVNDSGKSRMKITNDGIK
jgi:TolB-like protein